MDNNTVFGDIMQALHEVEEYQKGNIELRKDIMEIPDEEIKFYSIYRKLSKSNKQKALNYVNKLWASNK